MPAQKALARLRATDEEGSEITRILRSPAQILTVAVSRFNEFDASNDRIDEPARVSPEGRTLASFEGIHEQPFSLDDERGELSRVPNAARVRSQPVEQLLFAIRNRPVKGRPLIARRSVELRDQACSNLVRSAEFEERAFARKVEKEGDDRLRQLATAKPIKTKAQARARAF